MFSLRLFGSPSIARDDGALVGGPAAQRHRLALLALLALPPARGVSREKLMAYLWPERDAERARQLLNQAVYSLRKALGEEALISDGNDLRSNAEAIRTDVAEFETALERADPARAVALYRAPFLDGFFLSEAPEFEQWAEGVRERLAGGYRKSLEALGEEAVARQDFSRAVEWWKIRAAQDPYDSRVAARLMRALEAGGNRAAALQHAALHQRLLEGELGMAAAPEIAALAERLRMEPPARASTAMQRPESLEEPSLEPPTRTGDAPEGSASGAPSATSTAGTTAAGVLGHRRPNVVRTLLAAGTLALVLGIAWMMRDDAQVRGARPPSAAASRPPAIAVLPFDNLGPADQDYFAAGMTEEIASRLSAVSGLGVVSSRATRRYAGTRRSMREVGRELGIDYVLVGSVRWSGSSSRRVRITLALLRAQDERQLWSTTYDRVIDDVFAVQSDIAGQVVDRLGITLGENERRRLIAQPTTNHEAYTLYLKGRYFWNKRTAEDVQLALGYFQRATDMDPAYSLAWVGIADTWIARGWYSRLAPRETYPQAKRAVMQALQFDSTLAEAHASLAHIHFEYDYDWIAAEREYRRAIELNPAYAVAHHWYGGFLSAMGRHEQAMQQAQTARSLDPLSQIIQTWVGLRYYFAGHYPEAIVEIRKALEIDRNFAPAHWHLGMAYEETGQYAEGVAEAERALALDPGSLLYLAAVGHAYARAGRVREARATLERLAVASRTRHVSAYHVATIHVALGDTTAALDWLDRALAERSPWIGYLNVDPRVAPLRDHPRFRSLAAKVQQASTSPEAMQR